jgi:hypothetical protein
MRKGNGRRMKVQYTPAVRASITFPPDLYGTLEDIAKQKEGVAGVGRTGCCGVVSGGKVAAVRKASVTPDVN